MKKQKEKVDYVRYDALGEELERNRKTQTPKATDLTVKVDPCEQQAQQWF